MRIEHKGEHMEPGFAPFNWNAPLDLEALIQAHPKHLTTKGMFMKGFLEEAARQGKTLTGRSYISFKDYPSAEALRLFQDLAVLLYPGVPIHEVLRRLGRMIYPTLSMSLIGRAIFAALGRDPQKLLQLVPRGYVVSSKDFDATLCSITPHSAIFHIRGYPNFPISFNIGILEGVLLACGKECESGVRVLSLTECEIALSWA